MDAIEMLTGQHREVEELFERLEKSSEDSKLDLLEQISEAFALHASLEEKIFYPACQNTDLNDQIAESFDEHEGVKLLIAEALEMDEEELLGRIDELSQQMKAAIAHHVQEEEEDLFPRARELLGETQLATLSDEMEAMSEQLANEDEPLAERMIEDIEEPVAPI